MELDDNLRACGLPASRYPEETAVMREVPVNAQSNIPLDLLGSVSTVLRSHSTLEAVLHWCQAQEPPTDLADVVVQDEFTHDIVLALGKGLFAVYDTT